MIIRCRFDEEALQDDKKDNSKVFAEGTDNRVFVAPEADCYEGDVQLSISDVDCSSPDALVTATFCFTAAPGSPAIAPGEYVTFTDLTNCLRITGQEFQEEFDNTFDLEPGETYAFGPADADGKITIPNPDDPFADPVYIDRTADVVMTQANGTMVTASACDPIPTIGQWGLLIFALMLSSLGLVFMTRRKTA